MTLFLQKLLKKILRESKKDCFSKPVLWFEVSVTVKRGVFTNKQTDKTKKSRRAQEGGRLPMVSAARP